MPTKPQSMSDCIILDNGNGDSKPAPRSGHRIVADDAFIYCFGGYNPAGNGPRYGLYPEVWRFCLATHEWNLVNASNCPEETASHSMILCRYSKFSLTKSNFSFKSEFRGDNLSSDILVLLLALRPCS